MTLFVSNSMVELGQIGYTLLDTATNRCEPNGEIKDAQGLASATEGSRSQAHPDVV